MRINDINAAQQVKHIVLNENSSCHKDVAFIRKTKREIMIIIILLKIIIVIL